MVHRDIKPENILCTGDQAIVADFGIARAVEVAGGEKLTGTGIAVGTPAYMSPEQAVGETNVDGRSAYQAHNQDLPIVAAAGLYDLVRDDPRFQDLLRRMNLPQ